MLHISPGDASRISIFTKPLTLNFVTVVKNQTDTTEINIIVTTLTPSLVNNINKHSPTCYIEQH